MPGTLFMGYTQKAIAVVMYNLLSRVVDHEEIHPDAPSTASDVLAGRMVLDLRELRERMNKDLGLSFGSNVYNGQNEYPAEARLKFKMLVRYLYRNVTAEFYRTDERKMKRMANRVRSL